MANNKQWIYLVWLLIIIAIFNFKGQKLASGDIQCGDIATTLCPDGTPLKSILMCVREAYPNSASSSFGDLNPTIIGNISYASIMVSGGQNERNLLQMYYVGNTCNSGPLTNPARHKNITTDCAAIDITEQVTALQAQAVEGVPQYMHIRLDDDPGTVGANLYYCLECPNNIGWRIINNQCVEMSGCDYLASDYSTLEECQENLDIPIINITCSQADFDKDGDVDAADLFKFRACYSSLSTSTECLFWDFNGDGHVGVEDKGPFVSVYGDVCPTVNITYSCTGLIPLHSTFCTGDNLELSANTPITLVGTCGAPKCEYTCTNGYHILGAECALDVSECNHNNVVDATEQCDGTDLDGKTCQSLGYKNGTLSCAECKLTVTSCFNPPACEGWQTTNIDGSCKIAWWVWGAGALIILIFIFRMMS